MGEKTKDEVGDVKMNNCANSFDNLTILKEFSNIVNPIRNEEFLETVPKAKLRHVKWVPMFNYLKEGILDEMVQELSCMWQDENMPAKLEILEKQKEKFKHINSDRKLWRPQLGDVKAQLKAHDAAHLQKQKKLLESLAKEYETRVNRLKKNVHANRGYLQLISMDIQTYQKKNEEFIHKTYEKIENHSNLTKNIISSEIDVNNVIWSEEDMEINGEIDNA